MAFIYRQQAAAADHRREVARRTFEKAECLTIAVPPAKDPTRVHRRGGPYRDMNPASISIRPADVHPVFAELGAAKLSVVEEPRSPAPYTEGYAMLEQASVYHPCSQTLPSTRTADLPASGPTWM